MADLKAIEDAINEIRKFCIEDDSVPFVVICGVPGEMVSSDTISCFANSSIDRSNGSKILQEALIALNRKK